MSECARFRTTRFLLIGDVLSEPSGRPLSYATLMASLAPVVRVPVVVANDVLLGDGSARRAPVRAPTARRPPGAGRSSCPRRHAGGPDSRVAGRDRPDARRASAEAVRHPRVARPGGHHPALPGPVAVGGVPHVVPGRCDGARPAGGAHRRSARRAAAPAGLAAAVGRTAPIAGPGRGNLDGVRQRPGPQGRDSDGSQPREGGTRAADRGLRHLDLAWSRRGTAAGVPLADTGRSPPRHVRARRCPAHLGAGAPRARGGSARRRRRRHRHVERGANDAALPIGAAPATARRWPRHRRVLAAPLRTRSRGRLRCSATSAPSARSSRPRSSGSGPTRPSAPSSRPSPT